MNKNPISVPDFCEQLNQKGYFLLGTPMVEIYPTIKGEQVVVYLTYDANSIHVPLMDFVLKETPVATSYKMELFRTQGIPRPTITSWEEFTTINKHRHILDPHLEDLRVHPNYRNMLEMRINLGVKVLENELGVMFQTTVKEAIACFKHLMNETGGEKVEHCLFLCKADPEDQQMVKDYMKIPYEWLLSTVQLNPKKYPVITTPYLKFEKHSAARKNVPIDTLSFK